MADADALLIQFAREPVPGRVKTRLVPALGESGACELHTELVTHTCQQLLSTRLGRVELWVDGDVRHPLFLRCLDDGVCSVHRQQGEDLGARMLFALSDGLSRADKVLLVGSDCPSLDAGYLQAALEELDDIDSVIGPAEDGGYVLIGATAVHEALFRGINWGASTVLEETLSIARRIGLGVALLDPRPDIDRPEDLQHWQGAAGGQAPAT